MVSLPGERLGLWEQMELGLDSRLWESQETPVPCAGGWGGRRKQGSDLPPREHWRVLGAAGPAALSIAPTTEEDRSTRVSESCDQTDKGVPCAEGWVGVAGSSGPQGVK